MRFFAFLAMALPTLAAVIPTPHYEKENTSVALINFALGLEHLENALYEEGLRKFSEDDFRQAGFPSFSRGRFLQIQQHERIHAAFFTEAIRASGSPTVKPCKYRLSLENPKTFVWASLNIETFVTAAYTGMLGILKNNDYRIAVGTILSTEARQAGWINSAIFEKNAWNTAFDIDLTLRQAWTLANKYIIDCPLENAKLVPSGSVDPFHPLQIVGDIIPGKRGQVRFHGVEHCEEERYMIVFMTGIGRFQIGLERDGYFSVPTGLANLGATFVFVTSDDEPLSDENTVAGPTPYHFSFTSHL